MKGGLGGVGGEQRTTARLKKLETGDRECSNDDDETGDRKR